MPRGTRTTRNKVVVVDDDLPIRFGITRYLQKQGYEVQDAGSCSGALAHVRRSPPDVAVLDYSLPDGDAFDMLAEIKRIAPVCAVIILTAHGSIDLAVKALQQGADHFLTKPVELAALEVVIGRAIENQRNKQNSQASSSAQRQHRFDPFAGTSQVMQMLAAEVRRIAATEMPVLIQGETGSGKGVLASWIHRASRRAEEPFVDLNCAGLSREFLETELFGHEKGAFTGAMQAKAGLLEVADRGTVFLDEIGDVDEAVQPKLLKVVEENRFRRLGDTRDRVVDVRLISATHHDVPKLVAAGRFRSDLFFRISTIVLRIPPLRERREDIPLLTSTIIDSGRGTPPVLSQAAMAALQAYSWPGNLRELRNVLDRAVLLADGGEVRPEHLQFHFEATAPQATGVDYDRMTLSEVERAHIVRVLDQEGGSVDRAATRLGMPRNTLYYKMKKHGIRTPSRRA